MQAKKSEMAIVVSEYGGSSGIVTTSQLAQEIVGEVQWGLVEAEKKVEIISEHAFQIDGSLTIEEVNEQLGLELPTSEYHTIGGLALSLFGRLPEEGEQMTFGNLRIVVIEVKGNKITKLLVTRETTPEKVEEANN
jgi:CBS domain containing-hemolysin-like protein